MNILYVIHYPVFGGPHNIALTLREELDPRDFSVTVAVPDEQGNAAKRLLERDVDVVQMEMSRLRASTDPRTHLRLLRGLGGDLRRFEQLIRERDIDVVVGGLANPQAAIAARRCGVRYRAAHRLLPRAVFGQLMRLTSVLTRRRQLAAVATVPGEAV